MTVRQVLAAATAMSLVALPVAAQAGTRAESAMPTASVRKSATVKKDENANGSHFLLGALALGAAGWGVYELFSNDDDDDFESNGAD